jgi:hypothetical protein
VISVIGAVFVRRLREGKTYADFVEAWYPDTGFGVPARILSGPGVADPREVVTIGFVDVEPGDLEHVGERVLAAEQTRHDRIEAVIESTELRTFFVVDGDHDFSVVPAPLSPDRQGFPWT